MASQVQPVTTTFQQPLQQPQQQQLNRQTLNQGHHSCSYIPNTSEKFKKVCKRKGIQVHFKGSNTLRTALGNPKDKDPKANQTGIIYHYQCPHTNVLVHT